MIHPLPASFLPSLFFAFRLVYIPASILSHTGHGLPYANAALVLCATFGMEYLTRRGRKDNRPRVDWREIWFVVVALLLLGLFPEEAPIGAILWAAVGAVWGRLWPGAMTTKARTQITQKQMTDADSIPVNPYPSVFIRVHQWLFSERWIGLLSGGLLGLTGLVGPGSWLVAGLLALWIWQGASED